MKSNVQMGKDLNVLALKHFVQVYDKLFLLVPTFDIITARKRSCGKVMFLHLSVSHSVHMEACVAKGGFAWQEGNV